LDYYGLMKSAFCLLVALLLTLGAIAQPAPAGDVGPNPARASAMDASLFYQLLLGELNVQEGDPGAGYSLLLDAARKTNDPELYQRAVTVAVQSRAGEAALQAAKAWMLAQPDSREAKRTTLQLMLALNRLADVGALLASELAATPLRDRAGIIAAIPRGFMRVTDKKQAARVVEQALADHLNRRETGAAAWVAIGRMRAMAGDTAGALDAARSAVEFEAGDEDAALLALELMAPGQPLAEPLVRSVLQRNPTPEVRMAYARVLLDAQRPADALLQLEQLTKERPAYAPAWLTLGLLQLQENRLEPAAISLGRFLEITPKPTSDAHQRAQTEAFLGLSQIAEKRKDFAMAEKWLERIENPDDRIIITVRRAQLLARQGRMEQARELIQAWPAGTPADMRTRLMAEVQLLRENGKLVEAYELLGAAIQRKPEDHELLYDQALVAEKMGNYEAMERLLRALIAAKPDYHHAYNALGYSFADRNIRLGEARKLINKALESAPEDPMIRDSLGWLEFRSGNTAEALKILQSAYKARPDADIAAHLGEVLWVSGQREQALSVWKEGLRVGADSETLTETLRRFRVNP
jgi:tetratricopeptide (TPR) repeat protein